MLLSAASMLMGKKWLTDVVAQIGPTAQSGGVLRIKLSDFPVLGQTGGSVRIGTSGLETTGTPGCLNPTGLYWPVVINRGAGGVYYALDSACAHQGCVVPTYNPGAGYIQCPAHGSRYGIDGGLIRGPAGFPLRSFATRLDGTDTLVIEIPDMVFDLTSATVSSSGTQRVSLSFSAFFGIEYEVQIRATLKDTWTTAPFSLTPNGPADQTSFPGNSDVATLYVDRLNSSGFYAVAMKTQEV